MTTDSEKGECWECNGRGETYNETCPTCGGSGDAPDISPGAHENTYNSKRSKAIAKRVLDNAKRAHENTKALERQPKDQSQ